MNAIHPSVSSETSINEMKSEIKTLESAQRPLDPNAEQRTRIRNKVVNYSESFLLNQARESVYFNSEENAAKLLDSPISEEPIEIETVLDLLDSSVIKTGLNTSSPGYMAYVPSGGLYHSSLADYLAAVTNRYAGVSFASPGAVKMERMLIKWLSNIVGYPESAEGDLTSGGSIANLSAIVTAREAMELKARDIETSVVYLSEQTHHCLEKALRIAGLGECIVQYIALDDAFRMRPDLLEAAIKRDRKNGLNPWLIVATAGTTDTGSIDPLERLADIASRYDLWFHVDGAYGGAFALCDEGKRILKGLEKSDSTVIDPHKGFFLPYGTGVVLVKEGRKLHQAHAYDAHYMQDKETLITTGEFSPADLSPELSRHFRGLRLWLPLKLAGTAPFKAALKEKILLTRYFHEQIQEIEGIETGPYPDLSITTFRYIPKRGSANRFNEKLMESIRNHGKVFLSSTQINSSFVIRCAILSFRTHLEHVEEALDIIKTELEKLK